MGLLVRFLFPVSEEADYSCRQMEAGEIDERESLE